jgi:bifunctional DNase/RNase
MDSRVLVLTSTLLIVVVGFATSFYFSGFTGLLIGETFSLPTGDEEIPQLSLKGYVKPEIDVASNVIFLTHSCSRIPMFTTQIQTNSIERGRMEMREFRPLTHDLIDDILDTFEMEVMMVKIENIERSTFFSKILIKQGNMILNLDARPSDAIAIAVRSGAPVYISEDLIKEEGSNIC